LNRTARLHRASGIATRAICELAADLDRYLQDRPVQAGRDSLLYRGRKFLRRKRAPVAAVGVTAATILAAVVGLGRLGWNRSGLPRKPFHRVLPPWRHPRRAEGLCRSGGGTSRPRSAADRMIRMYTTAGESPTHEVCLRACEVLLVLSGHHSWAG
jgi:hypothetical protein